MSAADGAPARPGVEFVAPAHEDDVLTAPATERGRFGRSGIHDVTVRRGEEAVAEFRGRGRSRAAGGGAGRLQHPRSRDDR